MRSLLFPAGRIGLSLLWAFAAAMSLASPHFPAYRDLAVYTTSAPAGVAGRFVARTVFVNRGAQPLTMTVRLRPCPALGFAGGTRKMTIAPGQQGEYPWSFNAPANLRREIVTGDIRMHGRVERDLYLAVQGPDPAPADVSEVEPTRTAFGPDLATFRDAPSDRVTEAARVVGTHAPRALVSIRAEAALLKPLKPSLTLASRGTTQYAIAFTDLPEPLPPSLAAAVADMQRVVALMSGATLPIIAGARTGATIRLRLAEMPAPTLHEAYRLRTVGQDVIVEADTVDGLANGVYGLLADHLGCRWFMPGKMGEEIPAPKDRTVRLPALDETRGSPWFSTGGASGGADRRWDWRNRAIVNNGRMSFGHVWRSLINPVEYPYEQFPDYYARDRQGKIRLNDQGWTFTNFCTTNPAVIDIVAKKTNAFFAAHSEAIVASLEPNDYSLMCLCDRCLMLDRQYGQTREDGRQVADRLLEFSRQIYERLDMPYRDRYLGILIYGNQDALPISNRPHPRHAGLICNFMLHYDHSRPWNDPTSPRNVEFFQRVKGWGAMLKQFGYYDYYGHWAFFGPWAMVHKMREDLPAFHELGGTFLMLENQPNYAAQGLNHYVAAALIRDLHVDVDLLLDDFFTRYYGPAAPAMREYWLTAERYYALERPGIMTDIRVAARPDFWATLEACLERAETLTAGMPKAQQRFADRVRFARDGFQFGQILYQHEARYGQLARRDGLAIDHAAAVEYLRTHRARLDEIQARYPAGDAYWPPLVASYFRVNVEAMMDVHRQAMK